MGEVWRARDPRLGREVAIKAIPDAFALDAERLARFEREARLLASLRHPNIAAIHGLEEADGQRYLVLEFVEGETLAERLVRGPLPLVEALDACRQIAAALESAHESGIVHRDLKPGNVKLAPSGEIKVLDFGLAKGPEASSSSGTALTQSPTLTAAMTGAGVVLGTAAYMSPEQARGKPVDRRTDIWSFGCVLFECLTGRRAFEGETVTDLVARILEREPDMTLLPADVPTEVRGLLARCLEKDARQRLRDIGEARLELERSLAAITARRPAVADRAASRRMALPAWGWFVAGAALASLAAWMALARPGSGPGARAPFSHFEIAFPEDLLVFDVAPVPDGSGLVVPGLPRAERGAGEAAVRLYFRPRDSHELRELPGTRGVRDGRFTPDGRWIVFLAPIAPGAPRMRLSRVPVDGSAPPVAVADWQESWETFAPMRDGRILVLDQPASRMWIVPAGGGAPVERKLEHGSFRGRAVLWAALPGDRAALVDLVAYRERGFGYQIGAVDVESGRVQVIVEDGGRARYSPTGHLLFARGEVLLAARFDPRALELRGSPVAVASGLSTLYEYLPGMFEILRDGGLLYAAGGATASQRRLGILDMPNRVTPLPFEPRMFASWYTVANDANTFAFRVTNALGYDEIWAGTLRPPSARRAIAFPTADCVAPVISPDARRVAYTRLGHDAEDGLYVADLGGGGAGFRVVAPESAGVQYRASSWIPDGSALLITRTSGEGRLATFVARFTPARDSVATVTRWRSTGANEGWAAVSRDGRWVAFESDQSGSREIQVAPLGPDLQPGPPFRVSGEGGGQAPDWMQGSRVLFYRSMDFSSGTVLDFGGAPRANPVSRETLDFDALRILDQAPMSDGRFLVLLRGQSERPDIPAVRIVSGWTRGLDRRIAGGR